MRFLKSCMAIKVPLLSLVFAIAGCTTPAPAPAPVPATKQPPVQASKPQPVIALALGGGAAKGFAHIGVIKALEAQGIVPDIVIGTSAGAIVGAMYASGKSGFDLQELAIPFDKWQFVDLKMAPRALMNSDGLAKFVNTVVGGRPIEMLQKRFGAVATDLASGESIVFRSGDTGTAVRASSSVPMLFSPVDIRGRQYVDGGLTSPVPIRLAREMGATFVIAVDISDQPVSGTNIGFWDMPLQTLAIMGQMIQRYEKDLADVIIRPDISKLGSVDFANRNSAILAGERAAAVEMLNLKEKLAKFGERP